jgi:hypothetical protein
MTTQTLPKYEVFLTTLDGKTITTISNYFSISCAIALNKGTTATVVCPFSHRLWESMRRDISLLITRNSIILGDSPFLVDKWQQNIDTDGKHTIQITATRAIELLARRIVIYPAGTAMSSKSGTIDDIMVEIFEENFLGDAHSNRDMSALLSVEPSLGTAPYTQKAFSKRNILGLFQDLCSQNNTEGTNTYFDIVYDGNFPQLKFKTYVGLYGTDRSYPLAAENALYVGHAAGNVENPEVLYDYTEYVNTMYVGGQGEGTNRLLIAAENSTNISPLHRVEAFSDGRNYEKIEQLVPLAYTKLTEQENVLKYTGTLLSVPGSLYGNDWDLGDKLQITHYGMNFTAIIKGVSFNLDSTGESISANLESLNE